MSADMATWKNALAGGKNIQTEFFDFIPLNVNDAFLDEAFSELHCGSILISKLKDLLRNNKNTGAYIIPSNRKITRQNLYSYCQSLSNNLIAGIKINRDDEVISNVKKGIWQITTEYEFFSSYPSDNPTKDAGVYDMVGDEFNDAIKNSVGNVGYCLQEALYGLTANYNIVYYLAQEVVDFPVDYEPYYKIWQSGSDIWYTEDGWLVLEGNVED